MQIWKKFLKYVGILVFSFSIAGLVGGFIHFQAGPEERREIRIETIKTLNEGPVYVLPSRIAEKTNSSSLELWAARIMRKKHGYYYLDPQIGAYRLTQEGFWMSYAVSRCEKYGGKWSFQNESCSIDWAEPQTKSGRSRQQT